MNRAVLVNYYRQIWRDIKEARKYIFVAILIFVGGNLSAILIPSLGERVISISLGYLKTFVNKNSIELLVFIFLKNASGREKGVRS